MTRITCIKCDTWGEKAPCWNHPWCHGYINGCTCGRCKTEEVLKKERSDKNAKGGHDVRLRLSDPR